MKFAIRMFALFVAFAGLASASFTPANVQALSTHISMTATDPGPQPDTPLPLPCGFDDSCFVSTTLSR